MAGLNDAQARRLAGTFAYVDELLRTIERLASRERSPFERARPDLQPHEARLLLARTARLRQGMLSTLERLGLEPPPRRGSARWSIQTSLQFAEIELAKLDATSLRAYGSVEPGIGELVGSLTAELAALARDAAAVLAPGEPDGLPGPVQQTAPGGSDAAS